jgi:tryptophanyl-tRNA synthetase
VPVGDDQRQHIELMRDVAVRFNSRFGEGILTVPAHRIPEVGGRIMDLQEPQRKMSTTGGTEEGTVLVLDDARTVEKKIKRAVTDSDDPPRIAYDPEGKPGVSNLLEILAVSRGQSIDEAVASLQDARGYGDLKGAVADAVNTMLDPVRQRYSELRSDEAALEATLAAGAEKARAIAVDTLADVRRAMGVGPVV